MPGIDEGQNEWRYRVKDPEGFKPDSFRRKAVGGGVSIVIGKLKNPPEGKADSMVVQAYRFDKEQFKKKEDVSKWLKEHDVTSNAAEADIDEIRAGEITDDLVNGWWDITASDIDFVGSMGGKPYRHRFSRRDIEVIAESYNPDIQEAAIKIGHKDSGPAHGWVSELRTQMKNGRLYLQGRLKQLSDTLRKALLDGRYRSRSAEVYIDFMGTGKPYLGGLAFLGAAAPAVKGLAAHPALAGEIFDSGPISGMCNGLILCSGEGPPDNEEFYPAPTDFNPESSEVSDMEAKDITQAIKDGFASIGAMLKSGEPADDSAKKLAASEAEKKELQTKLEAEEKARKEAEEKLEAQEKSKDLEAFKAGVTKAKDEQRITPADAEMYLKLGEKLDPEGRKAILEDVGKREPNKLLAQLSDPGDKGGKKVSAARAKYDNPFSGLPEDPAHERALELMEADPSGKLEYAEALNIAYAEDPDLGKLEPKD